MGFVLGFFGAYLLPHLYVLFKLKAIFRLSHLLLIPFAFLWISPLWVHFLLKEDHYLLGRTMYLISFGWMGFLFLLVVTLLIGEVPRALGFLSQMGQVLFALFSSSGLMAYGFLEALRPQVRFLEIETPKVKRPYSIGVIADLHGGVLVKGKRAKRLLEPLLKERLDLLVSLGDLVEDDSFDDMGVLKGLKPPLGKYAVLGNHEGYMGPEKAVQALEALGFRVLRGEVEKVGELILLGVDDPHVKGAKGVPFGLREVRGGFVLLLKHRPTLSPGLAFDLQLSAHTHGGQIFPFGLFVKAFYPLKGLHKVADNYLYVSPGLGTWGPPVRVFSPPEVTVLRLLPRP